MKPRLERLDVLRACACIGAFTFHSYISNLGFWAVSIFIMLSGFLLTYNGLDRAESFPCEFRGCAVYALRKIKRLYPLYFATLLVLALRIFLLAPENPDMEQVNIFIKQFILSVLLLQSWPPDTLWSFGFNPVGWYLSSSVILYFSFPFILRLVKRCKRPKSAFGAAVVIYLVMFGLAWLASGIHSRVYGADIAAMSNFQQWFTYVFPFFRIGDFTIGCLAGFVFSVSDGSKISIKRGTALETFAIAFFVFTQTVFVKVGLPTFFSCNLMYIPSSVLLVYTFALGKGHISSLLYNRLTRFIADYSVEIFLIHFAVIKYASPFATFLPVPFIFQQITFVSFAVILTCLSCYIWRRLGRRFPVLAVK